MSIFEVLHVRNIYLRCVCAVYMAAFCSLYIQIPGLYGENGILPAHTGIATSGDPFVCLKEKPTLLCFSSWLGLNVSYMMELLSLVGLFLSCIGLLFSTFCSSVLFAILWVLYLSLFQVGQTFLWFQWDSLLLDVGFLTIFVAPLLLNTNKRLHPREPITMWVVRWALFRLMFASGVVKLQSGCPTWWGLTALDVHYESQCIPTPLAWFAHQLPPWWQKLSVVASLVIEIWVPFFFFSPIRAHRIFAFYSQILLQALIILSGNYNFFNALTITLCLSLIDDTHIGYRKVVKKLPSGFMNFLKNLLYFATKWAGFAALGYLTVHYFKIKMTPTGIVDSKINFSPKEFENFVAKAVPFSIVIGTLSLLLTIAEALTASVFEVKGFFRKAGSLVSVCSYSVIAFLLFSVSLVPYTVLHPPTQQNIKPTLKALHEQISQYNIASSYGLFRHMTGVGGRPEVILEGANAMEGPWLEYEFPYKPGKLSRAPPFVAPHQPRVDWQMWFAALGTYHQNPWLISMVYKLLKGEKTVTAFLDPSSPWAKKPPKYIRANKYIYHYTSFGESNSNWWKRELEGQYFPIYTVDHAPLVDYLKKMKLIGEKDVRVKNKGLAKALDNIRRPFNAFGHHLTVLGLYMAVFVIQFGGRLFKSV